MERKVLIPGGMLQEAMMSRKQTQGQVVGWSKTMCTEVLESALRWISDGHMALPLPMLQDTLNAVPGWNLNETVVQSVLHQGLIRMFIAPEPEAPQEIKDLLFTEENIGDGGSRTIAQAVKEINERTIEAYRRGQKAGK